MLLIFLLRQQVITTPTFITKLTDLSNVFIGISGFLSAIIMIYLASAVFTQKGKQKDTMSRLSKVTQKMHNFRSIVELLMQSKMWMPGLKEYIDDEFAGLTFFEVKDFYKGKSKLAIEFLQENQNFADTENLYLELKSLLMTSPRNKKIVGELKYPSIYSKDMVGKWLEHKCASGLWYYFGYKFGVYKDALNLEAVFERHQEKIMVLANSIDSEAFEDSSFNEVFLSKLGEYMSKEVMPKLYQIQESMGSKLPKLMRYLYIIFILLVLFGVLLPLFFLLFNLPVLILIMSFSFVISIIFYIAMTFYQFLNYELNN